MTMAENRMPIFHHIQEEIDESTSVSFIKGLISSPAASVGTEQKKNQPYPISHDSLTHLRSP